MVDTSEALFSSLQQIKQKISQKDVLKNYHDSLSQLKLKGEQLKIYIDSIPDINVDFNMLRQQVLLLQNLKDLNTKTLTLDVAIRNLESKIIPIIDVDFNILRSKSLRLETFKNLNNTLNQINSKISLINVEQFTEQVEKMENDWVLLIRELRICPTCKQATTHVGECDVETKKEIF
jgi:hypothetical protein